MARPNLPRQGKSSRGRRAPEKSAVPRNLHRPPNFDRSIREGFKPRGKYP